MEKSKVDLGYLLSGSAMSPNVAERVFGTVDAVEVDVMKASAPPMPGSLANTVTASHSVIEELLRTAPDTPAMHSFLTMYAAHVQQSARYLGQLLQQEKRRGHE